MLIRRDGDSQRANSALQDETRLIARICAGDLRAFETLYRLYHPRLSHFLMRMLRRPAVVEEVLDDTLMVVWNRAETFNGRSKVSTWIFAIGYRKALKALRKLDEPVEDALAGRRASEDAGPEQRLAQRQVQAVLNEALDDLSRDHRTVVDLAYFHELGYREIAEIMDCPVDTVKTRMYHARRNLRVTLSGQLADWL